MHRARSHTHQFRSRAMTSLVSIVLHCLVMGLAPLTTLALAGASPSILTTHTLQSQPASPTQWSQGQQGQGLQSQGQQAHDQQSQGQQSQGHQSHGQQIQGQQSQGSPAVETTTSAVTSTSAPPPTETSSLPFPNAPRIWWRHNPWDMNGPTTVSPTTSSAPASRFEGEEAWNGSIVWDFDVELWTPVTRWAIAVPHPIGWEPPHLVVEIHYVEMEKNDSLEIFSLDANDTTRLMRHYKSSDGTAVSPILVPSHVMFIQVKTPEFRERRKSRFNLTYAAMLWYELDYYKPQETKIMYLCNGIANLPKAITCDRIGHCEQDEDEASCSHRIQGCELSWFPFRDKCFKVTSDPQTRLSARLAEFACQLHHGAVLATLQEPGAMQMAAGLIGKSGFQTARVGIRKVTPVSRRLRHLYRFLWQWGQKGGPIAYEQQQLQRDGARLDCAVLDVSGKPALKPESCAVPMHLFGYMCMKPNPTLSTESSSPSPVSLAKATQFPSQFPVKECPDGSYVHLFHRCLWGKETQTQNETGWSPGNLPLFECRYGQAVHYSLLCDGKNDCADGSDELDCRQPQIAAHLPYSFICNNFQAIPARKRCDGVFDCFDESDEEYCTLCDQSVRKYVMCHGYGCLPSRYVKYFDTCPKPTYNTSYSQEPPLLPYDSGDPGQVVLDGWGMSRMDKVEGNCSEGFYPCFDSYCIPTFLVNNGEKDCPRGEDEDASLTVTCPGYYRCQELGTCVHATHLCDGIYHCPNKDDELFCKENLVYNSCPPGYYSCQGEDGCIPDYYRCDGIYHCPNNDDEMFCEKSIVYELCPPGYYSCQVEGKCIPDSSRCDGNYNCHYMDDESSCDVISCPRDQGCECEGHAYTCSSMIDPLSNPYVRYLDVSHARNVSLENIHSMEYLFFLNLSFCGLDNVTLDDMPQLQTLDLSNNRLAQLNSMNLYKLHGLRYLDLSNNPVLTTVDNAFSNMLTRGGLHNLQILIMINVGLEMITSKGFSALSNLVHLDIRMNAVHSYTEDSLSGLTALEELYTDETNLCCSYFHASLSRCHAPVNELSSCSDLLGQDFFRVCLWSLSALALLGNAGVLIYRLFSKQTTAPSSQILVKTLCASDLLMGVYMMMIGVADAMFRGVYVAKENEWKNSVACLVAGFLSFVSSEVSALVVCLITLDRVLVICFPFNKRVHLSYSTGIFACCVVWFVGISLAAVPLVLGMEFYGQNGICIPLPITRQQFSGQSYAFGVFIVLNFVVFIFIGIGQASIYQAIHSSRKAAGSQQRDQDVAIARRLFLIILTDFCCWFPIGLMGLLAASGTPIPGEVNVWTAIFVLPLNSALNPFLYTLNSLMEKREKVRMEKKAQKLMGKLQKEIPKLSPSRAAELVRIVVQSRLVEREVLLKIMGVNVDTTADMESAGPGVNDTVTNDTRQLVNVV